MKLIIFVFKNMFFNWLYHDFRFQSMSFCSSMKYHNYLFLEACSMIYYVSFSYPNINLRGGWIRLRQTFRLNAELKRKKKKKEWNNYLIAIHNKQAQVNKQLNELEREKQTQRFIEVRFPAYVPTSRTSLEDSQIQ